VTSEKNTQGEDIEIVSRKVRLVRITISVYDAIHHAITFRQFRMQFNEDELQFDDVSGNITRGARTC